MKKTAILLGMASLVCFYQKTTAQTTDQIPKFVTPTTFTNSVISENSGNVGIDMAPTYKLDVSGTLRSSLDANIHGITIGLGANGVALNTAVGYSALSNSTLGYNVAVGYNSLANATNSQQNTAVGYNAMFGVTSSGNLNTAMGFRSMQDYTSSGSVAIGGFSMYHWVSGNYNVALGYDALRGTGTGVGNIGIGRAALGAAVTGNFNTALGYTSLISLTSGSNNLALGVNSGTNLTTGSNNILIGQFVAASSASVSNELNIGNWIYGANGSIGIGASAPGNKLEVTHGTAGNSGLRFTNLTSSSTAAASSGKVLSVNASGDVVLEVAGSGGTNYWSPITGSSNIVNNNTGGVVIGNLTGISNFTTGYKLYVTDGIITEKVKVKLKGAWPDFVFAEDYSLQPLSEVERFINKNKHLPGIAPAAEVDKNGVELGETTAQLVKKIEELTLYLIKADKEIKELQKKVNATEKKD